MTQLPQVSHGSRAARHLPEQPAPASLRVAEQNPDHQPSGWGVNGSASVISAVLATVLAIHSGFGTVIVLAVLLYGIAALSVPAAPGGAAVV